MSTLHDLLAILELDIVAPNQFRGRNLNDGFPRVFGGQIIAQAVIAAHRSVSATRHIHSFHGYFIEAALPTSPVVYEVEQTRDGVSFSLRRVVARQNERTIFSCHISFQVDDMGVDHQIDMPEGVPQPEELKTTRELSEQLGNRVQPEVTRHWERERPFDIKPVSIEHYTGRELLAPFQSIWFRTTGPVPESRVIRAALLAYLSDVALLDTATFAHGRAGFDPDIQLISLDHAMWFHRPPSLDTWLLFSLDSPSAHASRGFARGTIYSQGGTLIASVAQEGLVRTRRSA